MESTTLNNSFSCPLKYTSRPAAHRISDCGGIAKSSAGVYAMIFLVSLGLALFKNGAIIGRVITDKSQMDPAFSMRYTLVNVGAFIGTFLVGILYKDVFAKDGVLAPCFKMAALMMVLGGLWYIFVCWRFLGDLGKLPFKKTLTEEEKAAEAKKKEETGTKQPLTTIEKKRIGAPFFIPHHTAQKNKKQREYG